MVMKRILSITSATICSLLLVFSCNKPGTDPTPDPSINIDSPTILVAAGDNTAVLTFTSNSDWSVSSSESWCTVSPASGSASENAAAVTITLEPNTTGETRSTTITVKAGGIEKQVTVTQAPEEVRPEDIILNYVWNSQDDTQIINRYIKVKYQAPYRNGGAHNYYANVKVEFESPGGTIPDFVVAPEKDAEGWIVQQYEVYYVEYDGSYNIYFRVEKNPSTEPRTGHIRIATRDGQYISGLITVEQVGMPEHAVDIGLQIYWHEFNLGASAPEEFGDYYAWGELETKTTYTWDTYNCAGGDMYSIVEHNNGYSWRPTLLSEHDAVCQKMNPESVPYSPYWRIPSKSNIEELLATREHPETHKWEWTTIGSHSGWKITYLENGKSIFLPAGGYKWGDGLEHPELGLYWSTEALFENEWTSSVSATNKSYYLRFEPGQDGEVAIYNDGERAAGKLLRPVTY